MTLTDLFKETATNNGYSFFKDKEMDIEKSGRFLMKDLETRLNVFEILAITMDQYKTCLVNMEDKKEIEEYCNHAEALLNLVSPIGIKNEVEKEELTTIIVSSIADMRTKKLQQKGYTERELLRLYNYRKSYRSWLNECDAERKNQFKVISN